MRDLIQEEGNKKSLLGTQVALPGHKIKAAKLRYQAFNAHLQARPNADKLKRKWLDAEEVVFNVELIISLLAKEVKKYKKI